MRKLFALFCMASLSACAGSGAQQQIVPTSGSQEATQSVQRLAGLAAVNWNVQVGASHDSYAEQDLDYYPNSITVDAGDTIAYNVASGVGGDAHTVTFVPPGQKIPSPGDPSDVIPAGGTTVDGTKYVNSGILVGGQTFTLHFTKAGVYRILCLFHEPAMESRVVVQKAGTPYPHTAAYYLHAGEVDEWQDLDAAASSVALFPFESGGTTLAAGISPGLSHAPPTQSTVLRFLTTRALGELPAEGGLTVKAGTVLTWVNESSNEPHTITFALAGQHTVPNIAPDPAVNVVPPPGITTYDGTRIVNSGTILGGGKFMLKFTKPGSYFYGCLYHSNSRMVGTITVTP
ncbi:MAG: hypothetical protein JO322_07300 [Candidatus Eremiobacteraeota bacterium]|nr:hypothetical protein [Candidatus Eremiobacteraeota bacterium]